MVQKRKNYVGVSNSSSIKEAESAAKIASECGFSMRAKYMPMIGLQVPYKSQSPRLGKNSSNAHRFGKLTSILRSVNGSAFTTIHYYAHESWQLVHEIKTILDHDGIYENGLVGGVQINGAFPFPIEVEKLKEDYPKLTITLQVHPNNDSINDMAKYLAKNYKNIDYVIVDPSEGKGIELNVEQTVATYKLLRDGGFDANIVFAGNFNGGNVIRRIEKFKELLKGDDFSIDAKSGVKGEKSMRSYLRGAAMVLLDSETG